MLENMKQKRWQYILFICFIGYIYYVLLKIQSMKSSKNDNQPLRAAIVTLTRGDTTRFT